MYSAWFLYRTYIGQTGDYSNWIIVAPQVVMVLCATVLLPLLIWKEEYTSQLVVIWLPVAALGAVIQLTSAFALPRALVAFTSRKGIQLVAVLVSAVVMAILCRTFFEKNLVAAGVVGLDALLLAWFAWEIAPEGIKVESTVFLTVGFVGTLLGRNQILMLTESVRTMGEDSIGTNGIAMVTSTALMYSFPVGLGASVISLLRGLIPKSSDNRTEVRVLRGVLIVGVSAVTIAAVAVAASTFRSKGIESRSIVVFNAFESGSDEIKGDLLLQLGKVTDQMRLDHRLLATIAIHSDNSGGRRANEQLTRMRSNSIKKLFVANGVTSNRIHMWLVADQNPVASNASAEGRGKNRRIEVIMRTNEGEERQKMKEATDKAFEPFRKLFGGND